MIWDRPYELLVWQTMSLLELNLILALILDSQILLLVMYLLLETLIKLDLYVIRKVGMRLVLEFVLLVAI